MTEISDLSTEVIELIFSHLSWSNLARAMHVCKKWSELGGQPAMWRDFQLVVNFDKRLKDVERCLSSKRFSLVRQFKLVDNFVRCLKLKDREERWVERSELNEHRDGKSRRKKFELIWQLPRLENLDLSEYYISSIDLIFLMNFPQNLKSLTMNGVEESNTGLNEAQAQCLFHGLKAQKNLTELKITEDFLEDVDRETFASVINNLEIVELRFGWSTKQLEALINVIGDQETKLKKLSLYDTDLAHCRLDAKKLAKAVSKLESLYLCSTSMLRGQVEEILQQIVRKTCLKSLTIVFGFLECDYDSAVKGIPEALIIEARHKLETLVLE